MRDRCVLDARLRLARAADPRRGASLRVPTRWLTSSASHMWRRSGSEKQQGLGQRRRRRRSGQNNNNGEEEEPQLTSGRTGLWARSGGGGERAQSPAGRAGLWARSDGPPSTSSLSPPSTSSTRAHPPEPLPTARVHPPLRPKGGDDYATWPYGELNRTLQWRNSHASPPHRTPFRAPMGISTEGPSGAVR